MHACAAALSMLAGCSFALGTPSRYGMPSSEPADYDYTTGPTCHVYEATAHVDTLVTIASSVVSITGLVLRSDDRPIGPPLVVGGAAVAIPFFLSGVAGTVGKVRCQRWARELPVQRSSDLVAARP